MKAIADLISGIITGKCDDSFDNVVVRSLSPARWWLVWE
jgi:hypothetical protein